MTPTITASSMTTETKPDERLLALLRRGDAIMESQMDAEGAMKPFHLWPRKLRREFSRLAGKVDGK